MKARALVFLSSLVAALAVPLQNLSPTEATQFVGMTKMESKMIAMAKLGMYELTFTPADLKDFLLITAPIERYAEFDENVVLMDEFPYVPVVNLPYQNASIVLSNLVLEEKMDPALVTVQFIGEYQSFRILGLSLNATFDWKINHTKVGGKAKLHVPQAWIHQNVEIACSHEQPSILVWEGRINVRITDVDITTAVSDKEFLDTLAKELHSSTIVRKYIGNALQHQVSSAIGKMHWATQERMRESCLQCHGMRYSANLLEVLIKGDAKCINMLPHYLIDSSEGDENPEELAKIVPDAIKTALNASRPAPRHDDALELQGLTAVSAQAPPVVESLRPRFDWRDKFRHKKREGFIDEPATPHPWLNRLGRMWMAIRGETAPTEPQTQQEQSNPEAAGAAQGAVGNFNTVTTPVSVDQHEMVKRLVGP